MFCCVDVVGAASAVFLEEHEYNADTTTKAINNLFHIIPKPAKCDRVNSPLPALEKLLFARLPTDNILGKVNPRGVNLIE
jgi:hypothetical protein